MNTMTAIYVRQSEDKTGAAAAVDRQEKACRLSAEAKGWDNPVVYSDNDISAVSGKTRPAFEKLVSDIQRGAIDSVVVYHIDRLARSMKDLTRVIDAGKTHNVNICAVHGGSIDLSDPTGIGVAQILTAVAGMETGHKGIRQTAANRQRAMDGKAFWSRRPFGYDRRDGNVFTVPEEAAAIRDAAEMILSGATLTVVANKWNAAGLRTTTKEAGLWGITQLKRLLINPRYSGKRIYNGADMGAGKWEAILEPETQKRLEEILTDPRRRTAPEDMSRKYLLSGIALCGKCGAKMFASPVNSTRGKRLVYRCFGAYCLQRALADVDEFVSGVIVARLSRADATQLFTAGDTLATLRRRATDLRDRRSSLASMLADGLLSAADVREQAGKLAKALTDVEAAISTASGLNPAAAIIGAADVATAWEALPLVSQRQIIRALITITILPAGRGRDFDPEQIRIEWR